MSIAVTPSLTPARISSGFRLFPPIAPNLQSLSVSQDLRAPVSALWSVPPPSQPYLWVIIQLNKPTTRDR